MEKLTIRSTYTQVDFYARLSLEGASARAKGPGAGPLPNPGARTLLKADDGAVPGQAPAPADARSADGDTFTLSVEARAVQVTESITIETEDAGAAPDGACLPSGPSGPPGRPHAYGRHPGYPRLADPEDVAARIAETWDQEHKARGGSRRDFAAATRARLDHWKSGGQGASRIRIEHEEFRSEVAIRLSARLEQWLNAGDPPDGPSAPVSGPADPGAPVSGQADLRAPATGRPDAPA
jgi:hypothetical protein